MTRISARLERGQFEAAFSDYYRYASQRMERAMLIAVDNGRRRALSKLRADGQGAGLGRLFNAIGSDSDLASGKGVHRSADGSVSASGVLFIRSQSKRTRGAIEAYTAGADIRPVRGRWLWIASDQLPRVTGRFRMTPELYIRNGFEKKIGPLVFVRSGSGNPVLIIRRTGIASSGLKRSARALRKNGQPRKGQIETENLVAFIGIPRTARQARIDVAGIMRQAANELGPLFYQALGRI